MASYLYDGLGDMIQWYAIISYITRSSDTKVHGANMGPIWSRQDPGGPHVGTKNFAIWEAHLTNGTFFIIKRD